MLTRRESMLKALQDAGQRGCTIKELKGLGGSKWKRHLQAIEAGYFLRKFQSRFGPQAWRYVLLAERLPEPNGEHCPLPAQTHLFPVSEADRVVASAVDPDLVAGRPTSKSIARADSPGRASGATSIMLGRAA